MIIYLERLVQLISSILITYWLVNFFTPEDYGVYRIILSFSALIVMATLLGFNQANIRYIPEYLLKGDISKVNYQVKAYLTIQLFIFILVSIGLIYLNRTSYIQLDDRLILSSLLILALLNFLKSFIGESLHIAFSKRIQLTKIRIFLNIFQIVLMYVFVHDGRFGIVELQSLLVFYAAAEVLALLFGVKIFYPKSKKSIQSHRSEIRSTFRYSINNYGFVWVNFLRDNAATALIVSLIFGFREVALYSIALIIPNIVRNFTPSKVFSGLLMPYYINANNIIEGDSKLGDGMDLIAKLNVLYLIPACLYSIYMYTWIIERYFGYEYSNPTFLLSIFLFVNIAILSYVDVAALKLNLLERSGLLFIINIASISNILFLIVFSNYGLISIGIANFVSTLITVVLLYVCMLKFVGRSVITGLYGWHPILYIAAIFFSLHLIYSFFGVFVALVAPPIILFICRALLRSEFFTKDEKNLISSVSPNSLKRFIYE
jgi:O-antigen/teichoic acid export membrane protein